MDVNNRPALTIDEARQKLLNQIEPTTASETIAVADSLGRIAATPVTAPYDIPHFRNSAMDGYAVRHADLNQHSQLRLAGVSLAGHPYTGKMPIGTAVRITTGAKMPDEADTIVIQENVVAHDDQIEVQQKPKSHAYVRRPGDDISAGDTLIERHQRIKAGAIGLMTAQGISTVSVLKSPLIGLFSTGDELRNSGEPLDDGQIYDSNRAMLAAMLSAVGAQIVDLGIVRDNREAIVRALSQSGEMDFVVSSGGVSVGEADFVKSALQSSGELLFWKIAMKPGKPLATARLDAGAWFFGLPGNPVSSVVTCTQFVIPAVQKFLNIPFVPHPKRHARLVTDIGKEAGRFEFQRGIATSDERGTIEVCSTGIQDSHVLKSMARANCFICLEQESTGANQGDTVEVILFTDLPGLQE